MGWTCQHDHQGYCKLVHKPCVPGMKGCTLKGDFLFAQELREEDTKEENKEQHEHIDFAALVRSH